jgi:hypothetical protein
MISRIMIAWLLTLPVTILVAGGQVRQVAYWQQEGNVIATQNFKTKLRTSHRRREDD